MNTYIIDTECYKNYWLFSATNSENGKNIEIELFGENESLDDSSKAKINRLLTQHESVSFNGIKYDIPMISAALQGWNCEKLHKLSTKIITSELPNWKICKDHKVFILDIPNHIDLIEILIGQASLKIYGGRLHTKKMQDLPIEPDALIQDYQRELMRDYCNNDKTVTRELFIALHDQIELRKEMSKIYDIDLKSKSDAQIAEAVIKSELYAKTGLTYSAKKYPPNFKFNYQDPKTISFQLPQIQEVFERVLTEPFELKENGSIEIPTWLKKSIVINNNKYQMGIGGLHSQETCKNIQSKDGYQLSDFDVASYYPSIILHQKLAPESMGKDFLDLYAQIVKERIIAKNKASELKSQLKKLPANIDELVKSEMLAQIRKYTIESDVKKIEINGSFGKFGSKYSALYSPELLLQTTLTGQLALLMLIERLELAGIEIISANTDGIVTYYHVSQIDKLKEILFNWEIETSYNLEQTDYSKIAIRDVNNYIAVKSDLSIKGKGCFGEASLSKNPDGLIIYEAVAKFIAHGYPISKTIKECDDITKFVTVRKVAGGALFDGQYLGKAVRFYHSDNFRLADLSLLYVKNGNKVPMSQGCRPLMQLPDQKLTYDDDIDFNYYIAKANDVLKEVGYA